MTAFVSNPPQSDPPELRARTAPDADDYSVRSGPSAQYFVGATLYASPIDSADEAETGVILEMRYQEYVARRALEALFESGEPELLAI
jgi:hypothetical protein